MKVTFKDNSPAVLAAEKKAVEAALIKIGIVAKHNAQEIIKGKNIYDSGELYRTMDYATRTGDKVVDVGSPKNYAVFQELGTVKIKERPFLRPAIIDNISQYKDITAEVFGKALGVSAGGLSTQSDYYQVDDRVTNV